jgi:uncharacterized protein DUF1302
MNNRRQALGWNRMRPIAAATVLMAGSAGSAFAFEVDTGNPDVSIRWDNTVRYNVATRVEDRDSKIGNSAISDEGTYSFDKGDIVSNRVDVLSELDFVYKKNMGFRTSYAAWYDAAYGDHSESNPNRPLSLIPSYVNHEYSNYVKNLYHGPSGEWLDAFAFTNFDAGEVPVKLKAGRHTVFWGESLFLNGALNGISYAQMPLDLQKGFATPGVEAKELFRPLNQVSGQAQLTDEVSVAAQYFLQWEAYRYPEGGTYLGPVDFAFNGPDRQFLPPVVARGRVFQPGFAYRGKAVEPDDAGEYGLALRWSPAWLDGTLGFYFRHYSDKLPQAFITQLNLTRPNTSRYNLIYPADIDLYGISLAKEIGGISVGAELSYRQNTPLNSKILGVVNGLPSSGDTPGPRGDTVHGLINGLGVIGRTPFFDAATYAGELTWAHWTSISQGENLFAGEGYGGCTYSPRTGVTVPGNKWTGCSTKNYYGLGLSFTPTWYQVMAGVDLSMPLTYSVGLDGNAPTVFGGNEGNGNYSVGLGADIFQKYRADLKFISYFGHYKDNGTAVTAQNGFTTLLKDRDFVSLTFKTTF